MLSHWLHTEQMLNLSHDFCADPKSDGIPPETKTLDTPPQEIPDHLPESSQPVHAAVGGSNEQASPAIPNQPSDRAIQMLAADTPDAVSMHEGAEPQQLSAKEVQAAPIIAKPERPGVQQQQEQPPSLSLPEQGLPERLQGIPAVQEQTAAQEQGAIQDAEAIPQLPKDASTSDKAATHRLGKDATLPSVTDSRPPPTGTQVAINLGHSTAGETSAERPMPRQVAIPDLSKGLPSIDPEPVLLAVSSNKKAEVEDTLMQHAAPHTEQDDGTNDEALPQGSSSFEAQEVLRDAMDPSNIPAQPEKSLIAAVTAAPQSAVLWRPQDPATAQQSTIQSPAAPLQMGHPIPMLNWVPIGSQLLSSISQAQSVTPPASLDQGLYNLQLQQALGMGTYAPHGLPPHLQYLQYQAMGLRPNSLQQPYTGNPVGVQPWQSLRPPTPDGIRATFAGSFLSQKKRHTGGLAEILAKVNQPGMGGSTASAEPTASWQSHHLQEPRPEQKVRGVNNAVSRKAEAPGGAKQAHTFAPGSNVTEQGPDGAALNAGQNNLSAASHINKVPQPLPTAANASMEGPSINWSSIEQVVDPNAPHTLASDMTKQNGQLPSSNPKSYSGKKRKLGSTDAVASDVEPLPDEAFAGRETLEAGPSNGHPALGNAVKVASQMVQMSVYSQHILHVQKHVCVVRNKLCKPRMDLQVSTSLHKELAPYVEGPVLMTVLDRQLRDLSL